MSEPKNVAEIVQKLQPYADKGLFDLEYYLSQTLRGLEWKEGDPSRWGETVIRRAVNFCGDEVCVRITAMEMINLYSIAAADRLVEAKAEEVRAMLRAAMEPILASAFKRGLK